MRSKPPWRPSWSSMWSKNGSPVRPSTAPVPSRSSSTSMLGLLGGRACVARRRAAHRRTSARAARKASSSARGADGDPQAAVERGHDEQLRTSTERSSSACHTSSPSRASGPEQHEVGARRPDVDRQVGQAGDEPLALVHELGDPVLHLVDERRGRAGRRPAWRRRGGTAARPCRARRRATTGRRGSRGGRRPSTTSSRTCG